MIDYELIDSGEGRRLERFGKYVLDRPDPEVLWKKALPLSEWQKADATFNKGWTKKSRMTEKWQISVNNLKFWLKLTPFKHTGIFPEQSWQWEFITKAIKEASRPVKLLNLFAYTGASTMFAAHAGSHVTHVDASKPAVSWANENRELNGLADAPIRWIIDDALVFTQREAKRGVTYDAIVMDPPVYGHGPTGRPWSFASDFPKLLENCKKILSPDPLFILVNAYAVSTSPTTLQNALADHFGTLAGNIDSGELTIEEKSAQRTLSTGIWTRYSTKK
ncbi:MAG TPA: class I SAM-dependent methyltransferase [Patescibacteria group bacterium]|nr:class I SAM-dependent methyltransferase [Patescibacteria group bacterium]